MDKLATHYTFEIALKAFKEGKTIYRVGGYGKKYIKMETIINGKSKVQLGTLRSNNDFSTGINFDLEDVIADDWIIQEEKV